MHYDFLSYRRKMRTWLLALDYPTGEVKRNERSLGPPLNGHGRSPAVYSGIDECTRRHSTGARALCRVDKLATAISRHATIESSTNRLL